MVFGWSSQSSLDDPADEFLGTCDERHIDKSSDHDYAVYEEDGKTVTQFGFGHIGRHVQLAPGLMQGKSYYMTVVATWGKDGIENARPVIAYYEIPRTGG